MKIANSETLTQSSFPLQMLCPGLTLLVWHSPLGKSIRSWELATSKPYPNFTLHSISELPHQPKNTGLWNISAVEDGSSKEGGIQGFEIAKPSSLNSPRIYPTKFSVSIVPKYTRHANNPTRNRSQRCKEQTKPGAHSGEKSHTTAFLSMMSS